MLVGLFSKDRPGALLLLFLLVLLLLVPTVLDPQPVITHRVMPLFRPLANLAAHSAWLSAGSALVFILIGALLLDHFANEHLLLDRRGHLPALLFPLLLALGPDGLRLGPALAGMPLVVWALERLFSTAGKQDALGRLFESGFLLGLAAIVYLPYVFLVVVCWSATSVLRPLQWREYVVPLLGAVLPALVLHGLGVITSWPSVPMITTVVRSAETTTPLVGSMRVFVLVVLVLFALPTLAAFARSYQGSIVRGKDLKASFLAFAAASIVIGSFEMWLNGSLPPVLAAAPLAVLFSYPLLGKRRPWIGELGVLLLLGVGLWVQWG